jgi:hypothetical protein
MNYPAASSGVSTTSNRYFSRSKLRGIRPEKRLNHDLFLWLEFTKKNQEKETVMEQEIHITLRFNLATGKVNLNEIVYELKDLRDPLMLKILEQILRGYDDLISERLSQTKIYPSKARKGLGRHVRKGGF